MLKYFNDKNSIVVVDMFLGAGLDWKFIFVLVWWLLGSDSENSRQRIFHTGNITGVMIIDQYNQSISSS